MSERKLYRIKIEIAPEMSFPSVKAQEALLQLSEHAEFQDSKPDLFDPNLDESIRRYEFAFLSLESFADFEKRVRDALGKDVEIVGLSVESPPAAKIKEQPQENKDSSASRQIRVDSKRVEELARLSGELVILKERIASLSSEVQRFAKGEKHLEIAKALRRSSVSLSEIVGTIQERTREFQQVPIGSMLQRFQRVARETGRKLQKKIDCVIEGAETEVDGGVLDRVSDLLVHLVRNSADHGIEMPEKRKESGKPEAGRISLQAYHEEEHVVIEVSDDGRGIDAEAIGKKALRLGLVEEKALQEMPASEKVKFIFRSGFSTAEQTSEVSGRGVGLDVVKARVEELNGLLDFRTEVGKGSAFSIRLPLSLSVVQALLVESKGEIFALPLSSVFRVVRLGTGLCRESAQAGEISLPESRLSVSYLSTTLGSQERFDRPEYFLVELGYGVERYGLFVDRVLGRRELVIRPVSKVLGDIPGISGVAVLGDGRIVVVLDPRTLAEKAFRGVLS